MITKLILVGKNEGLLALFKKSAMYFLPAAVSRRRKLRQVLDITDTKSRFEQIYAQNLWGDQGSRSGPGSNLAATENLRSALPGLLKRYDIKTVLDVPCGDYHWMSHVIKANPQINYLGGDIVASMIACNNEAFGAHNVNFDLIDLTADDLPDADLLIVRDCLFHLSFADIAKVKTNIKRSKIKYLLTTTHIVDNDYKNHDIATGGFRLINIFTEPLLFGGAVLERITDHSPTEQPREMCLLEVALVD